MTRHKTRHPQDAFRDSPLITPERFLDMIAKPSEAGLFETVPHWIESASTAWHEDEPGDSTAIIAVRSAIHPTSDETTYILFAISAAIALEITRYGHSIIEHTNKSPGAKDPLIYLAAFFEGKPPKVVHLSRIIADALPYQQVRRGENPRDLRDLFLQGAGRPSKKARAEMLGHIERAAREADLSDAEVNAYVENMRNLLALHDELLGKRFGQLDD